MCVLVKKAKSKGKTLLAQVSARKRPWNSQQISTVTSELLIRLSG